MKLIMMEENLRIEDQRRTNNRKKEDQTENRNDPGNDLEEIQGNT